MTDFLKQNLQIYFIENPDDAQKIAEQVLINKRSRENAEKTRLNLKKKLAGSIDLSNRVQKFVDCRSRDVNAVSYTHLHRRFHWLGENRGRFPPGLWKKYTQSC